MKAMAGLVMLAALAAAGADETERITNAGFEEPAADNSIAEWGFFAREKEKGSVTLTEDAASGRWAARIVNAGERDWALYNNCKTAVKPGQFFELQCRMKVLSGEKNGRLNVVGYAGKTLFDWSIGSTAAARSDGWQEYRGYVQIPPGVDTIYLRYTGQGATDLLVDDTQLTQHAKMEFPAGGPKVQGWAAERRYENMGRGVVALECEQGVYVGWRLLKADRSDAAFDVYRERDGVRVKCNPAPVVQTTDFVDGAGADLQAIYSVTPAAGFDGCSGSAAVVRASKDRESYLAVPISDQAAKAHKVGIADLNGDGAYDYIVKHPGGNVDPWHKYWEKSPETYKIEARLASGEMLWIKDLGWNIERGIWYSPIVVADLDGDGLAEVAAKIGPEQDMRDAEGKVQSGEEWVAVYNGLTGAEITRAPWPARESFDSYNHASRNQLAVAYLDGRTPCLITLRGTYGLMLAEAWMLEGGKLKSLWKFSNQELWGQTWGQGAHSCLVADVDLDGRDELILGSMVLDDNGAVLWTTGKGHPDAHYYGEIDPARPGLEIAYVIESRQAREGGLHLVDALTGKFLWQLQHPTVHVHSRGICSDIDPMHLGVEIYGADADDHKVTEKRWLLAADGKMIRQGKDVDFSFGVPCAWWDADLQRELIRGRALDYDGGNASLAIKGSILQVADVIGDWREEVICTESGELRIYTSRIPARDRRVSLMQDDLYRMRVTMNTMGYEQTPTLSYLPAARSLNVNLTVITENSRKYCRAVIQAAQDKGYQGAVKLQPPIGIRIAEDSLQVDLRPGERLVRNFEIIPGS